jgi:hypothetical protein
VFGGTSCIHEPPLAGAVPELGCEGSEEVVGMEDMGEGGGGEWVRERGGEKVVSACATMQNMHVYVYVQRQCLGIVPLYCHYLLTFENVCINMKIHRER